MDRLKAFLDKFPTSERYNFSDLRKTLLILEIGYEHIVHTEESKKILNIFPENEALIFALKESASSYWPQLALDWIDSSKMRISANLREALELAYSRAGATQSFKHRIKKLLKQPLH